MINIVRFVVFYAIVGSLFAAQAQSVNTLSAQERQQGWKLLFNGKDLTGWHAYLGKGVGKAWRIEQGAIKLDVPVRLGNKAKDGGDIITNASFAGDFEFKADWKVSRLANSGIFFFVTESPTYKHMHDSGLELQILDDAIYEGAAENMHRAGDFFGVANARLRESAPVGQWNQVHVIRKGKQFTVSINGFLVQEHDLTSADWKQRLAKSPLKTAPIGSGTLAGHIGLQDWGSTVWYRNLKVRPL
ncbi:DUF1080 domain-containing protein [Fibrisoma montanum]|uniref:DUF1080 domain-containing protein n=1 Tax=Fibrisoma montanum TaxID=2305895 RepID=A0A418MB03_9BACT|nr:DUF1080 domain-containing protein [Fibrisoma montanum]RIV23551.1 DUF1080 domain-containing protein [Fibrisoma montanum]